MYNVWVEPIEKIEERGRSNVDDADEHEQARLHSSLSESKKGESKRKTSKLISGCGTRSTWGL